MPSADATRQMILESDGQFDMLFFASGEPTIHPKLFEHVELARSVGFTSFGMSSHFRTFSDPRFALKTLQAGFEYVDIALHAADLSSQLDVNPIGDGGYSLYEALMDPYCGLFMAQTAEKCAAKYGISREEQDQYALRSQLAAAKAWENGWFKDEIVPVETADFVRPESYRHLTPFGKNRGMMAFSLCEGTNPICKG